MAPDTGHPRLEDLTAGATLRSSGAVTGFAGCVLLGLGACSSGFSHSPEGWPWEPVQALGELIPKSVGVLLSILGVVTLIAAWWLLRPQPVRGSPSTSVLITVWSIPLILAPPALSADAFAYAELGWIWHSGGNPCVVPLGSLGGSFVASVDDVWVGRLLDYYPPGSLMANRLGLELLGLHPYWGVVGQRLIALAGIALMVSFLPRLAGLLGVPRRWANWLGILNPLVIVHGIGGAHVDALMVGIVVVSIWVALRFRHQWVATLAIAPALVGVGMGIKPYSGIAVVAVAGLPVLRELEASSRVGRVWLLGWRTTLATAVALAALAALSEGTGLGLCWVEGLSATDETLVTLAPTFLIGDLGTRVLIGLGLDAVQFYPSVRLTLTVVCGLVILGLLINKPHRPLVVTAWSSLLVMAVVPGLLPWYLILSAALLSLIRISEKPARALVFGLGGYAVASAFFTASVWAAVAVGLVSSANFWLLHRTVGNNEPLIQEASSSAV